MCEQFERVSFSIDELAEIVYQALCKGWNEAVSIANSKHHEVHSVAAMAAKLGEDLDDSREYERERLESDRDYADIFRAVADSISLIS